MAEESFMLVSLKENKAKRLAQVISNETSRKILDFLAKKEATETEIATALGLPISTVHYSLQHLVENKLVLSDEFHYSKKGKEIQHYKLANKLIIIAPAEADKGLMDKLRELLPVGVLTLAATFSIAYYQKFTSMAAQSSDVAFETIETSAMAKTAAVAPEAVRMMAASDSLSSSMAQEAVSQSPSLFNWSSIAIWFLLGAIFAMAVYYAAQIIRNRK